MGIVLGTVDAIYYSSDGGESWITIYENMAYAAIQKTWGDMPPALVAAYLYSFVFVS